MEVQQLLSVREIDIETLVLWRVFGIFLFTSLHSLSVLKLSMLICTLTKSQATCAPLWALLRFLFDKKVFLIPFEKKMELAAWENLYASCQMSLVKVMRSMPSVVLISQRMKTNGPCLDVNLNSVFCWTSQGVSPPNFFASYFLTTRRYPMCPHMTLYVFSAWVLAYVYQLTHPIFICFLSSPSSTRCQKQERLSKYTLPSFTEPLPS